MRVRVVWLALMLAAGTPIATGVAGASSTPARAGAAKAETIPAAACQRNKAAGVLTFVSPFGFDASVGILDVFAAQTLGYFATECLTVHFVTNSYVGNELVSSGAATITGEGSAADTMVDVADGSKFVGVSTFGDASDYAILTRPSITNLRQLQGQVLGYHAPIPVVLTEMLQAAHVNISKVEEVNDTSYDPTLLIHGRFDGLQAYQSNEPFTLRAAGDKFNEFLPSSFGVKGTFNVQVVNAKFLAAHSAVVADFLRAELHAFDYCSTHVATCISDEATFAKNAGQPYAVAHETEEWKFEVGLVKKDTLPGKGIATETRGEWAPERAAVVKAGLAKSSQIPTTVEDPSLVPQLYSGQTLLWPGN
jgi:NitT/TauT family transport system substrate-binding protein